jgi:short-subunit dehydrogenase
MNKTALITGASGGIGLEFARIHASKGDNVVLVARNKQKLDELKVSFEREFNINAYPIEKDLSIPGAANEVFNEMLQQNIKVDYLINNAGFGDFGMFAETDWSKQEKMINLNIIALTHLTRLFLPGMISRGQGKILNVASTAAFQPGPTMSVYFATKAFVLSFSEALNNEVNDHGITVTALCPGSTESNFHAVTMGDPGLVKERVLPSSKSVAQYGYNAMMKGKTIAIPGLKNRFMAKAVGFFPRAFIVKKARKVQEKKHSK